MSALVNWDQLGISNSQMVKLLCFPRFSDLFCFLKMSSSCFLQVFSFQTLGARSRICLEIGGEVDKGKG